MHAPTSERTITKMAAALAGPAPAAAANLLVFITGDDRLVLIQRDPDNAAQTALFDAVATVLQCSPVLRGYARDVLAQLPPKPWTAPDGELEENHAAPLSWLWDALFPPLGTRLVHIDLDELRAAHSRLELRWAA